MTSGVLGITHYRVITDVGKVLEITPIIQLAEGKLTSCCHFSD